MNDTIKTIMERRSTRAFQQQQIGADQLHVIMESATHAPSAMNMQGWHFAVIQNKQLIDWMNQQITLCMPQSIKQHMIDRSGQHFNVFYHAPTVVLVSGVRDDEWTPTNCAMATQNICLSAQSLGVASCVIGLAKLLFSDQKSASYCKELQIPDEYQPLYAVALGLAELTMPKPDRKQDVIHYIP